MPVHSQSVRAHFSLEMCQTCECATSNRHSVVIENSIMEHLKKYSEWVIVKKDGLFACKYCTSYSTNRIDAFKRHVDQKHLKIRKICECGQSISIAGLSRHKKKSCKLREKSTEYIVSETEYVVNPFKVKFQTKSDGTVSITPNTIEIGGVTFSLTPQKQTTINKSDQEPIVDSSSDPNLMDANVHGNVLN